MHARQKLDSEPATPVLSQATGLEVSQFQPSVQGKGGNTITPELVATSYCLQGILLVDFAALQLVLG